jgi:hypothetical protein
MPNFDAELERISARMDAKLRQLERGVDRLGRGGSAETARRTLEELDALAREFTEAREAALRNIGAYAQGVLSRAEEAYGKLRVYQGLGPVGSHGGPLGPSRLPPSEPSRYEPGSLPTLPRVGYAFLDPDSAMTRSGGYADRTPPKVDPSGPQPPLPMNETPPSPRFDARLKPRPRSVEAADQRR